MERAPTQVWPNVSSHTKSSSSHGIPDQSRVQSIKWNSAHRYTSRVPISRYQHPITHGTPQSTSRHILLQAPINTVHWGTGLQYRSLALHYSGNAIRKFCGPLLLYSFMSVICGMLLLFIHVRPKDIFVSWTYHRVPRNKPPTYSRYTRRRRYCSASYLLIIRTGNRLPFFFKVWGDWQPLTAFTSVPTTELTILGLD